MTTYTTVNVDLCIAKLKLDVVCAKGATYHTLPVARLEMAIRALEQQQAQINAARVAYREQTSIPDTAMADALLKAVEVGQ